MVLAGKVELSNNTLNMKTILSLAAMVIAVGLFPPSLEAQIRKAAASNVHRDIHKEFQALERRFEELIQENENF